MSQCEAVVLSPPAEAGAAARTWTIASVILLMGIILRWVALDRLSLWYDEGFTWWVSQQPLGRIIQIIRADTWPPLYYIVMHYWTAAFGDSEWAMRAQSALVSTLSLALGMALAWRISTDKTLRLLSVGLLAISVVQLEFSRDVRCYATATLLVLATLWTISRRIEGGSAWWMLAYVICAAALVYQHNIMWLFLACLHATWLLWPGRCALRSRIADMVLADLGVALLFAPWVPSLLAQFHGLSKAFWTQRPTFYDLTETLPWLSGMNTETLRQGASGALGVQDASHRLFRLPLFAITVVVIALALLATRGETRRRMWALSAVALGPLLIAFLYSQFRQSIYVERVFSPSSAVLPMLLAGSALGAGRLVRSVAVCGLAIVLLASAVSAVLLFRYPETEPWRGAMAFIQEQQQPGDIALFHATEGELMYDYFAHRQGWQRMPTGGVPRDFGSNDPPKVQLHVRTDADLDGLRQRLADPAIKRIWLVEAHVGWIDPNGLADRYFQANFRAMEQHEWPNITITRYAR